jgi:hypothetical protein
VDTSRHRDSTSSSTSESKSPDRRVNDDTFNSAIATYKGSLKKFFIAISMQLDIPTTETQYNKNGDPTGEKDLTVDALKEEIYYLLEGINNDKWIDAQC